MVLDAPAIMLTMNHAKRLHYRSWAALTKLWREAAAERARDLDLPQFAWVQIDFWPYQPKGVLADPGAHTPLLKAVCDGLQDAGVLLNDTGEQVKWIRMHPPTKGPAGVVLVMRGPLAGLGPTESPGTPEPIVG